MLRGGYGIFFEQENTDGRVNNNMVPFRLDETGINDLTQRRTMADFFNGKALTASAAPTLGPTATEMKMGRNHHFNLGVQQQISPSTVLEVNYVGNIGQLPERDDATSTSPPPQREACRPGGPTPSSATSPTSTPT